MSPDRSVTIRRILPRALLLVAILLPFFAQKLAFNPEPIGKARADGTYPKLLAKLARTDVLIIDDWGLISIGETERRDLLEIVEDHHGNRSTILTSQLPVDQWHDHVADPTVAVDAHSRA